jgi:DNA-binding NarL/FixJ family response regulator
MRSEDDAITVVVCDDHKVLAEGLAAILGAEEDIEVAGLAGTVAEVLELADKYRPDVILLDYELPDGDGVAGTVALKLAHPEIKVVMLTSYTDEAVLVAALEAGCSGYLIKHGGSQAVVDGVRLAAAGEALISPAMLAQLLPRLTDTGRRVGFDLSAREVEVLELFADGGSTKAIAGRLHLSANTVRNYSQAILTKLEVHSRLEAVAVAVRAGIIRRT